MSKNTTTNAPQYFKLRDIKTGREFEAEFSEMAGEYYEKVTGEPHSICDVEFVGGKRQTTTPRRKAGRKMKGTQPRVPLCFSVDPDTKLLVRQLRRNGYEVNTLVETAIRDFQKKVFEL